MLAFDIRSIGIDISKDKIDLAFLLRDGSYQTFTCKNNSKSISKFVFSIPKFDGLVVMESTSYYHLLTAIIFSEAGFKVSVLNPIFSSKYLRASVRKIKTDTVDSKKLAEIPLITTSLPIFKLSRKQILIRKKIKLIASFEKLIQKANSILSDYDEACFSISNQRNIDSQEMVDWVKELRKRIKNTEKSVIEEIKVLYHDEFQNLISVPGISPFLAALILVYFDRNLLNAKKWNAFAGLDLRIRASGKFRGREALSKRGDPFLRKRIFLAGVSLIMNYPEFKQYYDYLKNEKDRHHVEACVILAKKILRIAISVLKNNRPFEIKTLSS